MGSVRGSRAFSYGPLDQWEDAIFKIEVNFGSFPALTKVLLDCACEIKRSIARPYPLPLL